MQTREALRELAEITESQWGLVTSAQARARGVSHMNLTRMVESGDLVRLTHGVYRDAGAPSAEHEELRAEWLATEPAKLAYERLIEEPATVVVSGESAAHLHNIGDLRAARSEFTTSSRRQTQRRDVHFRTRKLARDDITMRHGLPVTTVERTVADLVEARTDLTVVGNALHDATRGSKLDTAHLAELLGPLAERNGMPKGDGASLLERILRAGGIDRESVANNIASSPDMGALVAAKFLQSAALPDMAPFLAAVARQWQPPIPADLLTHNLASIAEAMSKFPTPALPDVAKLANAMISSGVLERLASISSLMEASGWAHVASTTSPPVSEETEHDR